jgi:hypothetical protein
MTKESLPRLASARLASGRLAATAAVLAALAVPLLRPVPARAWWVGGVVVPPVPVYVAPPAPVYVAPPVVAAPPPVVYAPRPVARWVPGHYTWRGFWVPGHWV